MPTVGEQALDFAGPCAGRSATSQSNILPFIGPPPPPGGTKCLSLCAACVCCPRPTSRGRGLLPAAPAGTATLNLGLDVLTARTALCSRLSFHHPPRPAGGAPLPVRVDSMFPERVTPASGLHRAPKYCTSHERGWFCSLQRLSKTSGRFAPDFQGTALSAESSASCLPTAPGSQGTPPRLTAVCGFGALGADSLTPEPFTTSLGRLGCLTGNC